MGETRLPWWMVLLLGVWVAGLAVWQSPHSRREIRLSASLLSFVYLGLLLLAMGGDPRGPVGFAAARTGQFVHWGIGLGSGAALMAAVLLLGRPGLRGQFVWFAVLTLANAGVCAANEATTAACALVTLAAGTLILFAREVRREGRLSWAELLPVNTRLAPEAPSHGSWLVGGTGFLLALVLLGTLGYTLRVETTRATASRRYSALPSPERVRLAQANNHERQRNESLFDWAFGRRADVVVLLAVLVFVALAMTKPTGRLRDSGILPLPEAPG